MNNLIEEDDGFIYKRTGTGIDYSIIIGYGGPKSVDLIIPEYQKGIQLKTIGTRAFFYINLKSVVIPESVEKISQESFYATGITSVTIPSSVKTIGGSAFKGNKLKSVIIKGKNNISEFFKHPV